MKAQLEAIVIDKDDPHTPIFYRCAHCGLISKGVTNFCPTCGADHRLKTILEVENERRHD